MKNITEPTAWALAVLLAAITIMTCVAINVTNDTSLAKAAMDKGYEQASIAGYTYPVWRKAN